MKPFRFSLQKVLDVRTWREEQAQQALSQALRKQEEAHRKAVRADRRLARALEEWTAMATESSSLTPFLYETQGRYIVRARKARQAAHQAWAEAQVEVAERHEDWAQAARDREVLETLRDEELTRYRRAVEKEALAFMDELALARHLSEQGAAS